MEPKGKKALKCTNSKQSSRCGNWGGEIERERVRAIHARAQSPRFQQLGQEPRDYKNNNKYCFIRIGLYTICFEVIKNQYY